MDMPLIDIAAVAERLGTTTGHIYSLVKHRLIPHHKIGGLLRFDPERIEEWIDEQEREAVP